MSIGKRIKLRRQELGLSIEELASKINKDKATIYRYENNEIEKIPATIIEPLSIALNTSPAYIMGWENTNNFSRHYEKLDEITFAKRLKRLRRSNNYTLENLSLIYNKTFNKKISKGTISKYETGKQEPVISVVKNFAILFKVSTDYMLGLKDSESFEKNLHTRIKQRRIELNLTMLEIAQKVGVSEATVSRWESGNIANMRCDKVVALATVLNVSPNYIIGWDVDNEDFSVQKKFNVVKKYNQLNHSGKIKVESYIDGLLENSMYIINS